jgi:hypothetical protein
LVEDPEFMYRSPDGPIANGCIGWPPLTGRPPTIVSDADVGVILSVEIA